jgi:glyoxylase I family protein
MKFFHTALSVRSIQESRAFYEDVFGLKLRAEGERAELGVRFAMLEDQQGVGVELFEHINPIPLSEDLMNFSTVGMKHIAFVVENIEKVLDAAVQAGAKVIWPVKDGITVKRLAFISDPNNIPIELVEL